MKSSIGTKVYSENSVFKLATGRSIHVGLQDETIWESVRLLIARIVTAFLKKSSECGMTTPFCIKGDLPERPL